MGEQAEQRIEHPEPGEAVPFLMVFDCVGVPDPYSGMLPFATVMEEVKQALASQTGVECSIAHVSIRDSREEILHAIEAVGDEEGRRRG